ncbi:MAG: FG-GAP repeat domain-containing protein, partial [Candidatus Binatia bacterium]
MLGTATSDIDDDGDIDIITAGLDGVKVYIQQENNSFEAKIVDDVDALRVQVIDLNNDGPLDLLVTLKDDPGVRWYRNTGNIEFTGTSLGTGNQGRAYAGDINGDGAADIIAVTNLSETLQLRRWMNDGSGTFSSTTLDSDSGVTAIIVADINGNGYDDIITLGSKGLQHWDTSDGFTWA